MVFLEEVKERKEGIVSGEVTSLIVWQRCCSRKGILYRHINQRTLFSMLLRAFVLPRNIRRSSFLFPMQLILYIYMYICTFGIVVLMDEVVECKSNDVEMIVDDKRGHFLRLYLSACSSLVYCAVRDYCYYYHYITLCFLFYNGFSEKNASR